jgi:hypothetical protein
MSINIERFYVFVSVFLGDDRMLIERFIEDPHHIEIQVRGEEGRGREEGRGERRGEERRGEERRGEKWGKKKKSRGMERDGEKGEVEEKRRWEMGKGRIGKRSTDRE